MSCAHIEREHATCSERHRGRSLANLSKAFYTLRVRGLLPVLMLLGGGTAGCATILGLDLLEKVDCVDCDDGGGQQKDAAAPIDGGPAYAIRGTVAGLASGELVLENNRTEDLVVTANGPFAFRDRVSNRAPYAVSVFRQPTEQFCIVGNGSGTVAGADVTNVQITCAGRTYSVGGIVSGMIGTGLVLENNGRDDLPVTGNGPFNFATGLANGASYAVTVLTQPSNPTQSCSVSSGSGMVTSTNVTGIVVNCTSGSFTVGGSVTGLVGSGLALQNNGGNDLAIPSNGSFTFSTPISTGSPYAVTVRTQPGVFEQTCTVTGGTGTMGAANVSNVQVACGGVKSITLGGGGGQIPDGRGGCTANMPGTPRTSDITIATDHFTINDVTVTLVDLEHGFAGDLTAQLLHVESKTVVDLFRRVKSSPNLECGSRGVFQGTYRFNDSFAGDLWSFPPMVQLLPEGDYHCSTNSGTKALLLGATGFRGKGVAGTWRLVLIDNTSSDVGSFGSWTLRLAP
jgi:hypothetical protein